MKHKTPDSMKFKRLMRRLGESKRGTAGLLELLWVTTQNNAKRGDIGQFSNEEIAIECDYEGDPDELIEALVETEWLDRSQEHRLVIHDWEDHCPAYLKKSIRDAGGFAKSDEPRESKDPSVETQSKDPDSTPNADTPPIRNVTKPNLTKPSLSSEADDGGEEMIAKSSATASVEQDARERPSVTPQDVFEAWNDSRATKRVVKLSDARRASLRSRLRDQTWPWREAIAKLPIPNDRNFTWQPDFDWLIANDTNAWKIVEGKYDRGSPVGIGAGQTFDESSEFGKGF